jgi:hypothetical protein
MRSRRRTVPIRKRPNSAPASLETMIRDVELALGDGDPAVLTAIIEPLKERVGGAAWLRLLTVAELAAVDRGLARVEWSAVLPLLRSNDNRR